MNPVPELWTAGGESALSELGPCPHDNSCVGCRGTKLATCGFCGAEFHDVAKLCVVCATPWICALISYKHMKYKACFCYC